MVYREPASDPVVHMPGPWIAFVKCEPHSRSFEFILAFNSQCCAERRLFQSMSSLKCLATFAVCMTEM